VSWRKRLHVNGWSSASEPVDRLLQHLDRGQMSENTRNLYCRISDAFFRECNKDPDELVGANKNELEENIRRFLDKYSKSPRTANTYREALKTFFKANGRKDVEFPSYRVRARFRIQKEYVPTLEEASKMSECAGSLKARAIIMLLYSTGLRNSTLRALKYGVGSPDPILKRYTIKGELERGEENIAIVIYPEMKKYISSACKGKIPYFIFTPKKTTEALKDYLYERSRKYGNIVDEEFLFPSDYTGLLANSRGRKPLSMRMLQVIVKTAARRANIEEWKYVTPKALRKVFDRKLRNQPQEARLDTKDQEFFMGHILPGPQDNYYDRTKIEDMREIFSKLSFVSGVPIESDRILRELADIFGQDYDTILHEAEQISGGKPSRDVVKTILRKRVEQGKKKEQRIIEREELQNYLDDGWEMEHKLSDTEIVISRTELHIGAIKEEKDESQRKVVQQYSQKEEFEDDKRGPSPKPVEIVSMPLNHRDIMTTFIKKVRQMGTSVGITIPREVVDLLDIKVGDTVEVDIKKPKSVKGENDGDSLSF